MKKEVLMTDSGTRETPNMPDFQKYLFPGDMTLIRCVDERQAEDSTNGVEIPGGVYGVIDAVKHFAKCSEEEAWAFVQKKGIPIGGHIDEHHGPKGCGYARLVEEEPSAVLAPEKERASNRLEKIRQAHGQILTLLGEHHPTHAVINHRENYSLDPGSQAEHDGFGIFNFDKWAAKKFGVMLGFNGEEFANHLEDVYRRTVTKLTGITLFHDVQ